MRLLLRLCCTLAFTLGPASFTAAQTPQPAAPRTPMPGPHARTMLTFDEYSHLLNLVFPFDQATTPGLDYTIVLRFEPNLHSESQLVLRRWHNGRIDATLTRVLQGNVWRTALDTAVPGQPFDLRAIASRVDTREYKVTVTPAQMTLWHNELFPMLQKEFAHVRQVDRRVQRTGTREAVVNGTRYELWFIQADDELHTVAWDAEVGALPTGAFPIAQWATKVRYYAANHIDGAHPDDASYSKAEAPYTPKPDAAAPADPAPATPTDSTLPSSATPPPATPSPAPGAPANLPPIPPQPRATEPSPAPPQRTPADILSSPPPR